MVTIYEFDKERVLHLPTCLDRVLEHAILTVASALTDTTFYEDSYGFRPGRSTQDAHAMAAVIAEELGLYCWLKLDIRKAFDTIPRDAVISMIRRKIPNKELADLIELIIRRPGTVWEKQDRGIHQGGPLSPWIMNVFADEVVDKPFCSRFRNIHLIRYADDLLIVGRTTSEAREGEAFIEDALARHGMELKKEDKRCESNLLYGREMKGCLGLDCYVEDGNGVIQFDINEDTWSDFKCKAIRIARETEDAEERRLKAEMLIRGWLHHTAPTLGTSRTADPLDIPTDAISILQNVLDIPYYDERYRVAHEYGQAITGWLEKRRTIREAFRAGRRAPPPP